MESDGDSDWLADEDPTDDRHDLTVAGRDSARLEEHHTKVSFTWFLYIFFGNV